MNKNQRKRQNISRNRDKAIITLLEMGIQSIVVPTAMLARALTVKGADHLITVRQTFIPPLYTLNRKSMKKTFDWEQCSKQHRPEHVAWLKANHDKPIKEAEYMAAYRDLRSCDNRPNNARRYSSAKLKGSYRRLCDTFGFFA